LTGTEGVDFVSCRICGDRRRVISGRHLSKHDTDRKAYMEEYELSPDELVAKDFRVIQSGRDAYQPYSKSQWITAIRKFYRQNGTVWASDLQHSTLQHLYNQGVWFFGDWYSAIAAAGLNPDKLGMHTFWDKDRVIVEIQKRKRNRLPLFPVYVMKTHPELFSAANRHYGSWAKAVGASGLKHLKLRSGLDALCELRDAMESGQPISKPLIAELEYYFGSVDQAKHMLTADGRLGNRWSRKKVLKMISEQANGDTKGITMWRKNPALFSAARKRFGTWREAVKAAGVVYGRRT
jgi:hypothetical protein